MTHTSAKALEVAPTVIKILKVLNIAYGFGITVLLVGSFFIDGWPQRPLGFDLVHAHPMAGLGIRLIMVIGIVGAVIMYTILQRLLAIVDTVRDGDPFIMANAERLNSIAWRVVAIESLRPICAAIATAVWAPGKIEAVSIGPWLAVLLLFVLAGVFAQGARMRADLDGTV